MELTIGAIVFLLIARLLIYFMRDEKIITRISDFIFVLIVSILYKNLD